MRKFIRIVWLLVVICYNTVAGQQNEIKPLEYVSGHSNIGKYLNAKKWNELFPNRYGYKNNKQITGYKDLYSFNALAQAARKFPGFLNNGDDKLNRRELAAFLANIAQETSGGWADAPGGYFAWGLHFAEEQGCENGCANYSDTNNTTYPAVKGISYHGRGPKQLSWSYNYGQFSVAYFGDKETLLKNPSLVSTDPIISFSSAIWFWMTPQFPKPSCHDIITGKWQPNSHDIEMGRQVGFGATVNVINGGVECGNNDTLAKTQYRYHYYLYFCKYLQVDPGPNIKCGTQKPFNL